MRPQLVDKIVWAQGEDLVFARRLFHYIEAGHVEVPRMYRNRWGRPYFDLDDDGETIAGFTNVGWERLGVAAYRLGRVGVRSFIGTRMRWDSKRQRVVLC